MTDRESIIRECIAALPEKNPRHQALEALLPEPVDPLLIEAREIAAKYWEDEGCHPTAEGLRAGRDDDTASVKIAYAALKSREAK